MLDVSNEVEEAAGAGMTTRSADYASLATKRLSTDEELCAAMRRIKLEQPDATVATVHKLLVPQFDVSLSRMRKLAPTAYLGIDDRTDSVDGSGGERKRRPPMQQVETDLLEALEPYRAELAVNKQDLVDKQSLKAHAREKLIVAYEAALRKDFDEAARIKLYFERPGVQPNQRESMRRIKL